MKPTRKWIAGGTAATLGIVAVLIFGDGGGLEVTVATVTRDTLSATIPAEGRTRARDRFTVAAPVSGRLSRLELDEGDSVTIGQVLARLYPAPEDPRGIATARAEVDAAQSRLFVAEALLRESRLQAEQAAREVERRRPLLALGAITQERLEQAELAAVVANERREAAEASVASVAAALEGARARLLGAESRTEGVRPVDVTAPASGRVASVPDESERVVAAGTPLLELAGAGGLEVVLDILSEDAVRVQPGNDVVITGWGGDGTLRGRVRTMTLVGYTRVSALGVEEQRVDVIADLHEVPPTLGVGYRVAGEIVVWSDVDVLRVPLSALFREGDAWRVFVAEGGRASRRTVMVGHRNEDAAEVVDGLTVGEQVIIFPPEGVDDGSPIRALLSGT